MKLLHPKSNWGLSEWRACLVNMLRDLREKAGLTQQQLATSLKRDQTFVSKYERGERNLDFFEVLMVGRALGLTPRALFAEFESECWKKGLRAKVK